MATKVTFQKVLKWSDEECRQYLEARRWPHGAICPKCGVNSPYRITRKTRTKNAVQSLYKCRECRKQFTATVGTIFEDTKIPLGKWFAAIYLMCASKKGISAHQIHRTLGITYKSAWFMCHRIREAMKDRSFDLLSGVVEADETYVGGKSRRGQPIYRERIKDEIEMGLRPKQGSPGMPHARTKKAIVFGIKDRGGQVRTMVVSEATARTLSPILTGLMDLKSSHLMTDAHAAYRLIKKHVKHSVVKHELTYVDGDVHTQNIENYWSILKRGLVGTFHHVDADYLPSYLNEFEFRANRRKISDEERFGALVAQVSGARLRWFCQTPQPQNPFA